MEQWGGEFGGRFRDIPPLIYIKTNLEEYITMLEDQGKCNNCGKILKSEPEIETHLKTAHMKVLKRNFRKAANEKVEGSEVFQHWLNEITDMTVNTQYKNKKYTTKNAQFDKIIRENAILKDINKILKENETILNEAVKENQNE
jgi:hypothetical protein